MKIFKNLMRGESPKITKIDDLANSNPPASTVEIIDLMIWELPNKKKNELRTESKHVNGERLVTRKF